MSRRLKQAKVLLFGCYSDKNPIPTKDGSFAKYTFVLPVIVFLLIGITSAQSLKNYTITNGYTAPLLHGGSVYQLTPTVGQYMAVDSITNGGYSLSGGIWGFYQLPPNPPIFTASQGDYPDKVKLEWYQDKLSPPANRPSYKIYRDNILLATLDPNQTFYEDMNVLPGVYYNYTITGANEYGTSSFGSAVGFVNPNGTITGRVTSQYGTPVNDVEILITPNLGKSLKFNGIDTYVNAGSSLNLSDTSFSIEFWLKLPSLNSTGIVFAKNLHGSTSADSQLVIGFTGSSFYVQMNTTIEEVTFTRDTNWHHFAWIFDKNTRYNYLYIDSQKVKTFTVASALKGNTGSLTFGKGYSGICEMYLDEVRVWTMVRDSAGIVRNMQRTVNTNQTGLAAYWKMDEGKGSRVFDYASKKNTGTILGAVCFLDDRGPLRNTAFSGINGYYIAEGINYGSSTNFTITPNRPGRIFTPSERVVTLSTSNTAVNSVDFTDISQIPVSGFVYHQGTTCLNDTTVEILVDDSSWTPQVFTNPAGKYLVEFSPGESHKIAPKRSGYTFNPAFYQIDSIRAPLANKNFTQVNRYNLKVLVAGGKCEKDLGGTSRVIIKSMPSGCIADSLTITSPLTYCIFTNLLPLKYMLEVKRFDGKIFEADSIDMQDTNVINNPGRIKKFIYHSPLQVIIDTRFLPTRGTCNKVVLEQLQRYIVKYRVCEEYYNNQFCYVDSAMITVNNEIGDVSPPYILGPTDVNGEVTDTITASYPNILSGGAHPYQKLLSVIAIAPDSSQAQAEYWALVTGVKFRGGQTFVTHSPEIVTHVLHQPPGDLSSSYWTQSTTIGSELSLTANETYGNHTEFLISLGPKFETSVGTPFFSVKSELTWIIQLNGYFDHTTANATIDRLHTESTASEMISTGGNGMIQENQGDVFVGVAYNFVFGKTNIVRFNDSTCSVVTDTGLIGAPDSVRTKFVYTEQYIRNTLIPNTISHAANYHGDDSVAVRRNDECAVRNWQAVLDSNDRRKAEPFDQSTNISFSAGSTITRTASYSRSNALNQTYESYWEGGPGAALGFFQNDVGGSASTLFHWGNGNVRDTTRDTTTITETGYTLGDDDVGDFFSVNVGQDKKFNTPIFKTIAGASSCPWEPVTMTRDSAVFNPTLLSAVNVHPDSAAVFPLLLGNAGSTNESRNYLLSVVQQTNPYGLVVSVNGVIIENAINLTLPPGGGVQVMVTVKRGPLVYDYEGVQLFMQPECEPDPLHNGNIQLAATANITVHFLKPCSQVNITQPEPGWLINSSNRDTMQVSFAGYDASHPSLQNIKLQYRLSLKSNERSDNPEFFTNAGLDAAGKVRSINFSGLPVIPFSLAAKLQQRKTAAVEINSSFCESGYLMLNSYAKSTPKKYHLLTSYMTGSAQPAVTAQSLPTEESKVRYLQAEQATDAEETPVKQRADVLKSTTGLRCATDIVEDDPKSSWFTFKTLTKEILTGTNTITVPWVVTGVDDGMYDIRAVTTCGGNTIDGTSALITGTIDQTAPMVQGLPQPVNGILTGNEQIAVSFTEQVQCYGLNTINNIQLYYASGPQSGQPIDINFTCDGRTIVVTPNIADRFIENQVLKAIVKRVKDLHGNAMKVPVGTAYTDSLTWEFVVQKSPVRWQGGDISIVKYPDETVQVTRQLVNSSGFPNSYFIRNIPNWLDVSSTAGTVPNQGNVPITFSIGTGLPNGIYEVTVTDSTVYGDQPLRVHVQVVCRPPDWTVDESGFEYSMNIVGELFIDTAACHNTNDLVGVFVGQQLRGAAQLKQLNSNTFRVFITVYSDSVSGEPLQMRVWDSSSCNEYGQIIEQFTFSSNAVLGTIGNPVRITATNQMIQEYSMKSGWTWISFNTKKADMSVSNVLSGLHPAPDKDIIKDQTSHAQFTNTGIWFGSLDTILNEKMYLLKLTQKDSLSHVGYPVQPASSPIFLNAGWNYIGYLPQGTMQVNSALATVQPQNGDIIKSQFSFAIYDTAFGWFGDLPYMKPRLGYFIKISRQDTLIYPDGSGKISLPVIADEEPCKTIAGQPDWAINANDYQYSMSVVAKLAEGIIDSMKDNTAVGLFAGNVCRGFATPLYDAFKCRYLFYLTIYGNTPVGDSLLFRVYDAKSKRVLALMRGIRFEADKLTGNFNEPYEITGIPLAVQDGRIIPAEFSLSANYPNPFNPTTTISFALPVESDVTIAIYNIMGERVKQIVNEHKQAGFYSVVWDGRNDYSNIVATGVYIYSMNAGKYQATRKLTFLK